MLAVAASSYAAFSAPVGADYPGPACKGCDFAGPPINALASGHLTRFFETQPFMGPFTLLLRAPVVAVARLAGGGELSQYRLGALICLLLAAALSGVLLAGMPPRRWRVAAARSPAGADPGGTADAEGIVVGAPGGARRRAPVRLRRAARQPREAAARGADARPRDRHQAVGPAGDPAGPRGVRARSPASARGRGRRRRAVHRSHVDRRPRPVRVAESAGRPGSLGRAHGRGHPDQHLVRLRQGGRHRDRLRRRHGLCDPCRALGDHPPARARHRPRPAAALLASIPAAHGGGRADAARAGLPDALSAGPVDRELSPRPVLRRDRRERGAAQTGTAGGDRGVSGGTVGHRALGRADPECGPVERDLPRVGAPRRRIPGIPLLSAERATSDGGRASTARTTPGTPATRRRRPPERAGEAAFVGRAHRGGGRLRNSRRPSGCWRRDRGTRTAAGRGRPCG